MFSTRALLATSAILEGAVGVALLLRPSIVTSLLLGSAAESTVALIAAGLLTFVAVVEGLQSPLTWPVVLLHVAMMVWCVLGLRRAGGS